MTSQLVAYVDESSVLRSPDHQDYLVCAALLDFNDLEPIRETLRPLRLPGQIKLHWTDENRKRRKRIIETLASIDSMQVIITHRSTPGRKTERFRRKCLEQLYYELSSLQIHDVTLESRQATQNRRDIEHIVALQGRGLNRGIRIHHVRGGDDPLLWIPDAVLGALNSVNGDRGQLWGLIEDKVLINRATPESISSL